MKEFFEEENPDYISEINEIFFRTARVAHLPNGEELLRKYIGNRAEILIEEAEHEA